MRKFLPWLLLGPVTGPLLAWAYHSASRGHWARLALSLGLLAAFWLASPALLAAELAFMLHLVALGVPTHR